VSEPVSIIYVHHERAIGGAPISLLFLLQKLDRARFRPYVLCLREGPAADLFRKNQFDVRIIPGPDLSHTELVWFRWWQFPKWIFRIFASFFLFFRLRIEMTKVKSEKTIVHLNSSTLSVAAFAAKSLSLPLIWHIREPLAPGYFGIRRTILRTFVRTLPDHVIAISHNDAEQLGKLPANQLSVIHNFVDFSQFDEKLAKGNIRKELGISREAFVILFLGGSARVKGAYVLLQAIPRILQNLSTAHIIIAGELEPDFQNQVRETLVKEQNKIHLLGARQDIPALLVDSNVLIFPSTVPHFARPVIEAAAMAKPVIASNLDGVRELVVPNETGLLIPSGDPLALSQAILELAADETRAFRLGQQGLVRAREKFDANRNSSLTFSVYDRILQGDLH
jgi:glycosyltransferase involved in cell wall biosynthesis